MSILKFLFTMQSLIFAFQPKFYVKMPLTNRTKCLKFDVHFSSKQFAFQTESKLSNARTQSLFTQRVRANFKELKFPIKQSIAIIELSGITEK